MDAGGDRVLHSTNTAVIREVYDNEFSQDFFSVELEKALESRCSLIIIEPTQLGEETARWISFGNYLHKTAVVSGLTSVIAGFAWPDNFVPQAPLSIISTLCTGLYTACWQFDPCVKYQVERDIGKLTRLPVLQALTDATSPVVLVRKEDTKRKVLHCTVSLAAASLCIYRLYRTMK